MSEQSASAGVPAGFKLLPRMGEFIGVNGPLYLKHLSGAWRWIYVTTALMALYLNVFVLIVQSFQKLPALQKLAPTQSEPPFLIAQAVALIAFLNLGAMAARKFRPDF